MNFVDFPALLSEFASTQSAETRAAKSRLTPMDLADSGDKVRFRYRKRRIALDRRRVLLRLWNDIEIDVRPKTGVGNVVGWNIEFPLEKVSDVEHMIARKFLSLFSKAKLRELNEYEQADWIRILDAVDYRAFTADWAAPRYVEGRILAKRPRFRIEWNDGKTEYIQTAASEALLVLEVADKFGAYVKWGSDEQVKTIERVTILTDEPQP
jgi:hypothetical protein